MKAVIYAPGPIAIAYVSLIPPYRDISLKIVASPVYPFETHYVEFYADSTKSEPHEARSLDVAIEFAIGCLLF